jgi:hypothetical protein
MQCIDKDLSNLKRSDCVAAEKSGFKPYLLIATWADIETWCTFGNNAEESYSANEKKVLTAGNISLKAGKKWIKAEVIDLEKIKVSFKKNKNSVTSDIEGHFQNSMETRGWSKDLFGKRVVILAYETESSLPLLFGHSDGWFAEIKPDGMEGDFGMTFVDEKQIKITFEYKPLMPYNYTGTITPPIAA